MKTYPLVYLTILTTLVLVGCDKFTEKDASPPTITAQGFKIEIPQEGEVGHFNSLRLRIESPAGIESLQIKERSYDVDLATTPDRDHFQLFALDRRVLLNKDVTLDFKNYINNKLNQPGEYTFVINVTDKKQQPAQANISVRLTSPAAAPQPEPANEKETEQQQPVSKLESSMLKTGMFEIKRIGPGELDGDETFGLTWKTIDAIHVTIRVKKKESGASKLASFSAHDYERVNTQAGLEQMLAYAEGLEHIDFNTANNAAFGNVLGVINSDKYYLLKSNQSNTVLSDTGTTVTVKGEYKYH